MTTITEITTHLQTGEVTVTTRERTQADIDECKFDESMKRFIADMNGDFSFDEEERMALEGQAASDDAPDYDQEGEWF